jgi:hypothetical protein
MSSEVEVVFFPTFCSDDVTTVLWRPCWSFWDDWRPWRWPEGLTGFVVVVVVGELRFRRRMSTSTLPGWDLSNSAEIGGNKTALGLLVLWTE